MVSRPSGEKPPKAGENEEPERKLYRINFEELAKGLFRVSPGRVKAEEKRQRAEKRKRPR